MKQYIIKNHTHTIWVLISTWSRWKESKQLGAERLLAAPICVYLCLEHVRPPIDSPHTAIYRKSIFHYIRSICGTWSTYSIKAKLAPQMRDEHSATRTELNKMDIKYTTNPNQIMYRLYVIWCVHIERNKSSRELVDRSAFIFSLGTHNTSTPITCATWPMWYCQWITEEKPHHHHIW